MSGLKGFYTYDLDRVIALIRRRGARRVLIQLPDGLKAFATGLLEELMGRLEGVGLVLDANPVYGPCVLNSHVARYYDLVLHLGHDPYPYRYEHDANVIFVDLLSTLRPSNELLAELAETLNSMGLRRVAVYTVHQHKGVVGEVVGALTRYGIWVANPGSTCILGCWFGDALRYAGACDGYVVVSGGLFHPLGLGLHLGGRRSIVQLDPYRSRVNALDSEVRRYLRVRYGKLMEALDARSWCLVHGIEGQYRGWIRDRLVEGARARGIKVYEVQTHTVSCDALRNLDSTDIDVYVVTACPRLPIDDLADFEKPVLTPGEALMILAGELGGYVFPW